MLRISISSFSNGHRCNHHVRREKREGQGTLLLDETEYEEERERKKIPTEKNDQTRKRVEE